MREVLLAAKVRSCSAFYKYQFFSDLQIYRRNIHVSMHGGPTSNQNYFANKT